MWYLYTMEFYSDMHEEEWNLIICK
jgi:hypothetical protein